MSLYRHKDSAPTASVDERLALQGRRYGELMRLFLAHHELTAVTWWGVSDNHTSLNAAGAGEGDDQPLLFDRTRHEKPAYQQVLRAISAPPSRRRRTSASTRYIARRTFHFTNTLLCVTVIFMIPQALRDRTCAKVGFC
jgi:alpha-ketoglutarate-dependent taurine dioxygenase